MLQVTKFIFKIREVRKLLRAVTDVPFFFNAYGITKKYRADELLTN